MSPTLERLLRVFVEPGTQPDRAVAERSRRSSRRHPDRGLAGEPPIRSPERRADRGLSEARATGVRLPAAVASAFLRPAPAEAPTHGGFAPPRPPEPRRPVPSAAPVRLRPEDPAAERLPCPAGHGDVEGAVAAGPDSDRRPHAPVVAVLCPPARATAFGLAVGAALARGTVTGALVCRWPGDPDARMPAGPARRAARRLCAALAARDVEARAVGRLVLADLPPDPLAALTAGARAAAAAGDRPILHVVAGPRPEELTELLRAADRVLVATDTGDPADEEETGTGTRLAALAAAGLCAEGVDARPLLLPRLPSTRLLPGLGAPALRPALAEALEGLR